MTEKHTAAIVLAAGSGRRMNSTVQKQYMELDGKPLIYYALAAFEKSRIDQVVLVVQSGDEGYCQREIVEKYQFQKVCAIVAGGNERYISVHHGLRALKDCTYVLIHDGARPFVTEAIIERALRGAKEHDACVVGMPVKDTIKVIDSEEFAAETPRRDLLWAVQTPQAFRYELIREGYDKLIDRQMQSVTDDAMVAEQILNRKVKLIPGSYYNIKITTPEDFRIAEIFLKEYQQG